MAVAGKEEKSKTSKRSAVVAADDAAMTQPDAPDAALRIALPAWSLLRPLKAGQEVPVQSSSPSPVSMGLPHVCYRCSDEFSGKAKGSANGVYAPTHLQVVPVTFQKREDVEVLWIESCKSFADLTNVQPWDISKRATYCLEV